MDIFTKPLSDITFQDVVDYCARQVPENLSLDYKREIANEGLAKTIAAMANTLGGVIIVGAEEDKNSKPLDPATGMVFEPRLGDRISDIIWGNINPPLPIEVKICDPVGGKTFAVLRVPQSNATPHAIRGNTEVYYRTSKGSQPESLAEVDRIEWLLAQRRKAVTFKEELYTAAFQRLGNLLKSRKLTLGKGQATFAFTPLYPREPIIKQQDIAPLVDKIKVRLDAYSSFPNIGIRPRLIQNGVLRLEPEGVLNFTEMSVYGSLYHKIEIGDPGGTGDSPEWYLHLSTVLQLLAVSFKAMGSYYRNLGYWGLVEFRFALKEIHGMRAVRLPFKGVAYHGDETLNDLDTELHWERVVSPRDLADEDAQRTVVAELGEDICHSFGYTFDATKVARYLSESGIW